jgi:hypothetical protein
MEFRRQLRVKIFIILTATVSTFTAAFGVLNQTPPAQAAQTVPYLINFQGRLTDNNGNILSDGLYNIKFGFWTLSSGGTNQWQADRVRGGSDNRVQITDGLFNIQFGDTTKGDPALSPTLFNSASTLYLEVELPTPATATCATNGCAVFTEGAMTPRQPLASSPYAFNSDTLDGLDADAFGRLATAQTYTDTNTFSKSGGAGIVLSGTPASGGSILQIGSALSSGSANGTLLGANTAITGDLLNLQVSGASRLRVDNSGNLALAAGTAITIGASTGTATTCSGGQFLQDQTTVGGIVTGGTCAAPTAGASTTLNNLGVTSINADLLPSANNTRNLGSASLVWANVFTRNITFDNAAATLSFPTATAAGNTLTVTGQAAGGTAQTGGGVTVTGGTGTTTGAGGTLTLRGGNAATTGTNGTITLDAGTGATAPNGTVNLGIANASTVNIGTGTVTKTIHLGATGSTAGTTTVNIGNTSANNQQTIAIGNTANTNSSTLIQGGATGGIGIQTAAAGTLSLQTTGNGAITTGTGLLTVGGNQTFSGTAARAITGPGTGGLTVTVPAGPLTVSTTTSGTLAVTSAGALNLTGAAASTWTLGANALTITSSNLNVSNLGAITAATSTNTINNLIINSGALSNITGYTQSSGNFSHTSGTHTISSSNTSGNVLAVSDTALNNNGANLSAYTFTNANSSATNTTISGISITPTGTTNANSNANTLNAVNFPNVTTVTNNAFYALNVGTGYNDILRYNGAQIISGTGVIQNAAFSGSYTNITGVGTLAAGTLGSGFTTVAATVGGTGQSSYAVGDLLYASSTTALSRLAAVATGSCLISQGVNTAPVWGSCGSAGASTTLNNLGVTSINAALIPNANNTLDLGTAAAAWNDLFVNNIDTGTATTTLTIGTTNATGSIQIGKAGVAVSAPGGITTSNGNINAGSGTFTGNGSGLTNLDASDLATGSGAVSVTSGGATALTLTSGSGTVILGSNTVQRSAASLTLDVLNGAASTLTVTNSNASFVASLSVEGGVGIGAGQVFNVGGTNGSTISACTSGQYLSSQAVTGGLVTGGSCATNDLQTTYNNSTSPATIALADGKNFVINASEQTTADPNILFNLQCATCSASGGRFAVQDNGTDVFTVNPVGSVVVAPTAGQNASVSLAAGSSLAVSATAAPTVDQVSISNAGQPVTATGVSGLQISYVGGAITASGEASAARIDVTPGSTNPSTWNGLRIASTANAGTGVAFNGIKLEGPGAGGAGTETGLNITTGWDVGVNIQSGGIMLTNITDPTGNPAAGTLRVYSKAVVGRSMLKALAPSGVDYVYQPSLFQQNVTLVTAGNATAVGPSAFGTQLAAVTGTVTIPTVAEATGFLANQVTAATANSQIGMMGNLNQYFRGSVANGSNGFFFMSRVSFPDAVASYTNATSGVRFWTGLNSCTTNGCMTNNTTPGDNPTGDFVGFRLSGSAGNTTFRFMTRDNVTTNNIDTTMALAQAKTYDMYFYVAPQGTTMYWRIDNLTDGTTVENSTATNLPRTTISMRFMQQMTTIGANARNLRWQRTYIESDR